MLVVVMVMSPFAGAQDIARYAPTTKTEQMLFADDPSSWAKPKYVVAAQYPKGAFEKNETGYVDLDVLVGKDGAAKQVLSVTSTPKNTALEESAREAVLMWGFHTTKSEACQPVETTGNVRIWFDIKDGKESISVSNRSESAEKTDKRYSKMINRSRVIKATVDSYPTDARRMGGQADVHAILHVDATTGTVRDFSLGAIETNTPSISSRFVNAVRGALMKAKFEPSPGKDNYAVCMDVSYRLSGHSSY